MTASPAAGNPPDTSSPHQFDAAEESAKQSPAATALTNARPTWWQLSSLRRKRADVLPHKHSDQSRNNGHGPGALTRAATDGETSDTHRRQNKISRTLLARAVTFGVVPVLLMALTLAAGCLKYLGATDTNAAHASIESVVVAKDGTVAMLSYTPATAEKSLTAAGDRMTGPFRDSYASLIHDVVIPGAKEKNVSAVATVPAAAAVSASVDHAVVLVYVNQTITIGNSAPTQTSSVVQVTLDRSGEQWRISGFDPKWLFAGAARRLLAAASCTPVCWRSFGAVHRESPALPRKYGAWAPCSTSLPIRPACHACAGRTAGGFLICTR